MTLEIDLDKLNARKSELQGELKRISDLIMLAEQFSKPAQQQSPTPSPSFAPIAPRQTNGDSKRGFTAGLRRAVILALHTGPSTEQDLAKALAWDIRRVRTVVSTMLKFRVCWLNEHGRLQLAESGTNQARWYLDHPAALTYRPQP